MAVNRARPLGKGYIVKGSGLSSELKGVSTPSSISAFTTFLFYLFNSGSIFKKNSEHISKIILSQIKRQKLTYTNWLFSYLSTLFP